MVLLVPMLFLPNMTAFRVRFEYDAKPLTNMVNFNFPSPLSCFSTLRKSQTQQTTTRTPRVFFFEEVQNQYELQVFQRHLAHGPLYIRASIPKTWDE